MYLELSKIRDLINIRTNTSISNEVITDRDRCSFFRGIFKKNEIHLYLLESKKCLSQKFSDGHTDIWNCRVYSVPKRIILRRHQVKINLIIINKKLCLTGNRRNLLTISIDYIIDRIIKKNICWAIFKFLNFAFSLNLVECLQYITQITVHYLWSFTRKWECLSQSFYILGVFTFINQKSSLNCTDIEISMYITGNFYFFQQLIFSWSLN